MSASLPWLVVGDPGATIAAIASLDARLDPIERVRAVWVLRFVARTYPGTAHADRAGEILVEIDPANAVPDEPNIVALRAWLELLSRTSPTGVFTRLTRAAGLPREVITRLREGRPVGPERRQAVAAAIVAFGEKRKRKLNPTATEGSLP